jgi:uncharacterized lipoprotein YddW (UPF0748 family)/N-acetylmuramoyl-L-alanine amidase
MKKLITFLIVFCMMLSVVPAPSLPSTLANESDVRGVWIASVYNIDFPSRAGLSAAQQKQELLAILNTAQKNNLNAVFFQVRPTADALYKSSVFPWSAFLTGSQGKANIDSFDPLQFLIDEGKKREIKIHAWINPLRVTIGSEKSPKTDITSLVSNHPARKNPNYVVASSGMLYFNPGLPQVRKLVVDGVVEIVKNYDVAGIHFDDYFYPATPDFADDATYLQYHTPGQSLEDWRRENINTLVKDTKDAIKRVDSSVSFGISPFGIWADKSVNPLGSDTTSGLSSYLNHYADSRKWAKEGYVDYIAPQLYWCIGYAPADYEKLLQWWADICEGTGTQLYIGHAIYKVNDSTQSEKWLNSAEIYNQLVMADNHPAVCGNLFYGYSKLKANVLGVSDSITDYYNNLALSDTIYPMPDPPANKGLIISSPATGFQTTGSAVSILGSCDPSYPLYFEGKQVSVTQNGHFCIYPSLELGNNAFTFSHQGEEREIFIQRNKASAPPSSADIPSVYFMSKPEFKPNSFYPVTNTTKQTGSRSVFGCVAPAGATVWVEIGSYKIPLTRELGIPSSPSLVPAKFTGTFIFPEIEKNNKITALGKPVFVMKYRGKQITAPLTNTISVQSPSYLRFAAVSPEEAIIRSGPSTSYEKLAPLAKGATDYIYGEQNGYYLLRSGLWIAKSDAIITENTPLAKGELSSLSVNQKDRHTNFTFKMATNHPYDMEKDGGIIRLTLYNTRGKPLFKLPDNPLISSVDVKNISSNVCQYIFTLKDPQKYFGYHIVYTEDGLVLSFKNPPALSDDTSLPLKNMKVLLDPGHGEDPGAIGPMSTYGPNESDIALAVSLYTRDYLKRLGATVITTRTSDTRVSLSSRVELIRTHLPDLSVSIHSNAIPKTGDYNKTTGLMTLYTIDLSKSAAQSIQTSLINSLGRMDKGVRYQSLAVCRLTHVPSILVETGFMTNPQEFEWLSNPDYQKELGIAIGHAIEQWLLSQGE